MNEDLILERLNELPDNLQLQVLDYIEFLINRYSEKCESELEEYENEEISPELKTLLEERLAEYRKNPQNVVSWEEIEEQFEKKYGYDL